MSMALFSSSPPPPTTLSALSLKHRLSFRTQLALFPRKAPSLLLPRSTDNGAGVVSSTATVAEEEEKDKLEEKKEETPPPAAAEKDVESKQQSLLGSNGAAARAEEVLPPKFKDARWVGGTWDLKRFQKDGKTDWDAVVDAEVRRRKWLEENPEASSNDEPVIFDTSIIPWWSWVKRFHLPEAELLNGRAAMIGFFMAYFVDSLTGVGLVDQMGNFFCKTLLFIAVAGVLLIRKNEDIDTLKKLLDEITFYDKQWQATWQEDKSSSDSKAK